MRKKMLQLLAVALVTAFSSTISAQENDAPPIKSSTWENWFISGGVSGNLLLGEQDAAKSAGDRIKFGGEISIGKWFNPNFGIRTQIMGGSLRGFNYSDSDLRGGEYTRADRGRDPHPAGYYNNSLDMTTADEGAGFWQDFEYGSMTIDLMANLTNLFRGYYRDGAPIEIIPFVGVGYLHGIQSNTNPTFDGLVGKLGARMNFNVSRKCAIFLEGQGNFTTEQFDGYVGNRGFDAVVNLMAGVQVHINKNFTSLESLTAAEIEALNRRINEQRELLDGQQDALSDQQRQINDLRNQKPQSTTKTEYITNTKLYLPEYIRFGLDSHKLETAEMSKIEDAAEYLKANPGKKLLLIGYADKKTGNPDYNYKLSCRRTDAVVAELVKKGINKDRIILKCVGDKEQPYDTNEWNRVVIMVER